MLKPKKAFTLIELLVVIAIIGVLATISVISLQNARAKSRDAKRIADIKQMQTALELYFNDMNHYPTAAEFAEGSIHSTSSLGTTTYMNVIPTAPTPADGNCTTAENAYTYSPEDNGNNYSIDFCLGGQVASLTPDSKCATPSAIYNADCCSSIPVVYAGQTYNTIKIGTQCWFKENLNVGTQVAALQTSPCQENPHWGGLWSCQVDPNSIEKYCYGEDANNCTTYGGLYEWAEMMGFPYQCNEDTIFTLSNGVYSGDCDGVTYTYNYSATTHHQGICPTGWHIPSYYDMTSLIISASGDDPTCVPEWSGPYRCSPAGTRLKTAAWSGDNLSEFTALPGGLVLYYHGFSGITTAGAWWMTNSYSSVYADYTGLASTESGVNGYIDNFRITGLSVRCVKD